MVRETIHEDIKAHFKGIFILLRFLLQYYILFPIFEKHQLKECLLLYGIGTFCTVSGWQFQ